MLLIVLKLFTIQGSEAVGKWSQFLMSHATLVMLSILLGQGEDSQEWWDGEFIWVNGNVVADQQRNFPSQNQNNDIDLEQEKPAAY